MHIYAWRDSSRLIFSIEAVAIVSRAPVSQKVPDARIASRTLLQMREAGAAAATKLQANLSGSRRGNEISTHYG
jgi:hypothetical protein